jgi:hypothetical protein
MLAVAEWLTPHARAADPEELRIDVRAAWDGVAREGEWTEVAVRVVAMGGGAVRVDAGDGTLLTTTTGDVEAGAPADFRLPVPVGSAARVAVTVHGPRGTRGHGDVPLRLVRPARVVVGAARGTGHAPAALGPSEAVVVPLDAGAVPATAAAFRGVDALVLDAPLLADLDGAQLRALERYLGQCGRVLLVGVAHAAVARARSVAGCGAALVDAVEVGAPVETTLARLLAQPVPPLPEARDLATLLPDAGRPAAARPLIGFFIAYAAALVGGLASRRAWLLPALPVAASVLLLAALNTAPPGVGVASWTEVTSGATRARFVALVRVDGMAPRSVSLDVPEALGLPTPLQTPSGEAMRMVARDGGDTHLDLRTRLLSAQRLDLRGALEWTAPLSVEMAGELPRVENRGTAPSAPGYFLWRGYVYALPGLEPAAAWDPARAEPMPRSRVPGWLAQRRFGADDVAALIPGAPQPLRALTTTAAAGWTIVLERRT